MIARLLTAPISRLQRFGASSLRAALALALILPLALAASGPAHANSKYAAFVMDADTGKVLYSRKGDYKRFPASLTKVMTLYLTFEALEAGQLKLTDKLKASSRAAAQPPSKIGIKKGQTITVKDAIQALVVRSANDVAVVLAEELGGTERAFARTMTSTARSLGMRNTKFRNASGLPNSAQTSTARDMAVLGQRVLHDFPQYAHFFKQQTFSWRGRKWRGHNRLLKEYAGTDGLKTGYTRASGFNLTTSVHRKGYHLIAVVMGGKTARRRDKEMMRILDLTLSRLKANPSRNRSYIAKARPRPKPKLERSYASRLAAAAMQQMDGVPLAIAALEPPAPLQDQLGALIAAEMDLTGPRPNPNRSNADLALALANRLGQGPRPEANPRRDGHTAAARESMRSTIVAALEALEGMEGVETVSPGLNTLVARPVGRSVLESAGIQIEGRGGPLGPEEQGDAGEWQLGLNAVGVDELTGGWGVQIGAFSSVSQADERLRAAAIISPSLNMPLAGIMPVAQDGKTLYRARFGPFDRADAVAACDELASMDVSCFTIEEESWTEIVRR